MADDRHAILELVIGYFRAFDERRRDAASLSATFTPDATVVFPAGNASGIDEIAALTARTLQLWGRTLHGVSSGTVTVAGDEADVRATLHATHIHRDDDPGASLHIGAELSGAAHRTGAGWRLRTLQLDLVWTDGDAPVPRDRA